MTTKRDAGKMAKFGGTSVKALGLRFDRVVLRMIDELKDSAKEHVPKDVSVIVTVTAPILVPSKTSAALDKILSDVFVEKDLKLPLKTQIFGNLVQVRKLKRDSKKTPPILIFVHNRTAPVEDLFVLIGKWLSV